MIHRLRVVWYKAILSAILDISSTQTAAERAHQKDLLQDLSYRLATPYKVSHEIHGRCISNCDSYATD